MISRAAIEAVAKAIDPAAFDERNVRDYPIWSKQSQKFAFEKAERALSAALALSGWRTIDSAPKDREIMVAGGTYYTTADDWCTEYPCTDWHLAYWDYDCWRGENDEAYDTHYVYKPTHWMEKIAPPATAGKEG
jgi:hypothetical protein